jgi:hypothetical protein
MRIYKNIVTLESIYICVYVYKCVCMYEKTSEGSADSSNYLLGEINMS